jgi:hypothetical protein
VASRCKGPILNFQRLPHLATSLHFDASNTNVAASNAASPRLQPPYAYCAGDRGKLPEFCHLLFGQIAKAANAATGHVEVVFAKADRPNLLEQLTPDAEVREIAYLLANPAKAGLVETAVEWPGLITRPEDLETGAEYIGRVGDNLYLIWREVPGLLMRIEPVPGWTVRNWLTLLLWSLSGMSAMHKGNGGPRGYVSWGGSGATAALAQDAKDGR